MPNFLRLPILLCLILISSCCAMARELPVTVVDQVGRKVTLEKPASRTAVLFPQALGAILVLRLSSERIVGIPNLKLHWTQENCPDFIIQTLPGIEKAPDIGYPGKVNVETLLMTRPDLIIGPSHLMKAAETIRELNIPVACVKAGFGRPDEWMDALVILARLHGCEDRLASYRGICAEYLDYVDERVARLQPDEIRTALCINCFMGKVQAGGSRTLMSYSILNRAGAKCPPEDSVIQNGLSLESIYLWNPDHIFIDKNSIPEEFMEKPAQGLVKLIPGTENLKAVVQGNVHLVPNRDEDCWFTSYFQAGNHPVGTLWAAARIYPFLFKSDVVSRMSGEFFDRVYGYPKDRIPEPKDRKRVGCGKKK